MPLHLIAALLLGCGGEPEDTAVPVPDPAIELGTGTDFFESLRDGDEIHVVFGPQGGYHLDGSVRVWGINPGNVLALDDPENPTTVFRVFEAGEQVDVGLSYTQGLNPVGGEAHAWQMIGRRVILDIQSDQELAGKQITFETEFSDVDGNVLTDSRTLLAIPHPNN